MKIKRSDIRTLLLINREVISNNELKSLLKNPSMQLFIANKNINVLKKEYEDFSNKENELKFAASNKDASGKPVVKVVDGMVMLDIPVELHSALQKDIDDIKSQEVEINLCKFSTEAVDVICKFMNDTLEKGHQVVTGEQKTNLLIEILTDIN